MVPMKKNEKRLLSFQAAYFTFVVNITRKRANDVNPPNEKEKEISENF